MVVVTWAKLLASPVVTFRSEFPESVGLAATTDTAWQEEYVQAMEGNPSKDVTYEHGMLYYQGCLWIPESDRPDLRREICKPEHDPKVAGDMGMDKTVEIIRRNFF